jgi:hydrogenase-4 component B
LELPTLLLVFMVLAYAVGAVGAAVALSNRAARIFTAAGAITGGGAGLALALHGLIFGGALQLEIPQLLTVAGGFRLEMDRLSAFFLLVVSVLALPTGLFGGPYSRDYEDRHSLRALGAMFNGFLLTLSLVPLAANILTFLFFWEGMAVTSYFLVMTEADATETRQAGLWYLGMAHGGLACLVAAFLLMGTGSSGTGFAELRAVAGSLPTSTRNAVFVLALVGFGSKAGIVPLHVWLPLAHPAAPSHVSALMSGAMIKMGAYGLLRVALDLLGGGPAWWGGLILAAGAISALLGVLYALMEHDLKRLLAYHSVENIGIILMGIGAGLLFQSYGLTTLAILGLVAGLYHALNHACFKGLLFLGAGAVLHGARTRNMEELGGLIKRMPRTAFFFLIGATAISGLPPLNGFMSEWLLFQALLGGAQLPRPELGLLMPLAVGTLALTGGLAAACFVKAFGITFLALPRSVQAAQAHEVPGSMQLGMGGLALACVALGVAAPVVAPTLATVLTGLGGLPAEVAAGPPGLGVHLSGGVGVIAPPVLALGLALVPVAVVLAFRLGFADRRVRIGETWGCGRIGQTARMEYTATAFAEPLRRVFAELYRPTEDLSIDFHPESKYFVQSIAYRSEVHPRFEQRLYAPTVTFVRRTAARIRWLQSGSLHLYLLYMMLALVALLVTSLWPD